MVEELAKHFEEQFQKRKNVPKGRPMSEIEWFQSPSGQKGGVKTTEQIQNLQEILQRIPREQFFQSTSAKREDQIYRKTKIMCTLGKVTSNLESVCKLMHAGMNIARINMSNIQHKEHKVLIAMIKKATKLTGVKCGIMLDLQGPVIRTGEFKDKLSVQLKAGQEFRLCCKKRILGNDKFAVVDFSELESKLNIGDHITADFGAIYLTVIGFENETQFLATQERQEKMISNIVHAKRSISFQGQQNYKSRDTLQKVSNDDDDDEEEEEEKSPEKLQMIDNIKMKSQEEIIINSLPPVNFTQYSSSKFRIKFDDNNKFNQSEKLQREKEIFQDMLTEEKRAAPRNSIPTIVISEEIKQQSPKSNNLKILEQKVKTNILQTQLGPIEESDKETKDEQTSFLIQPLGNKEYSKTVTDLNQIAQNYQNSKIPKVPASKRKKKTIKEKRVIICRVEYDGELKAFKPLFFPEFDHKNVFDMSVITGKDVRDIHSSIKLGVDYLSVSYVENKNDILEVKELLSVKGRHIKVIAKVQNKTALKNFDEILETADGIIIARGYLGLDIKLEDVAYIQKYLIQKCNLAGKPVILSTQIMESMVTRLRPTRAEVSDISNAVYEGIDCCILSAETAQGPFYIEAVETMSKICYESEQNIDYEKNYYNLQTIIFELNLQLSIGETISNCAVKASYEMNAKLIIVFTNSGYSAMLVQKYRPKCPILAVSASDKAAKQCMISKGINYLLVGSLIGAESLLETVKKDALKRGFVNKGDIVIVTTGINEGLEGSTNLLKILKI